MAIHVKCPYCYEFNVLTQHEFNLHNVHICQDCFHMFRLKESNIEFY